MVEQRVANAKIVGSIPIIRSVSRYPNGMGFVCKTNACSVRLRPSTLGPLSLHHALVLMEQASVF